jgi:hypothetical protein
MVERELLELGAPRDDVDARAETVLRDGETEVARVYRTAEFVAVWNATNNSLRIYNRRAELVRICNDVAQACAAEHTPD